jgi:hypothetical protein
MKSICLKLFVLLGFVLLTPYLSYSQGFENKKIQAGITSSFGLNFVKMGTSRLNNKGVGTNFSIGLLMHKSFSGSKNFGFASGLEFDFNAINFQSSPSSDSIFYNYSDTEILPSTNTSEYLFLLESRKHKITQITIPLALLFRTEANGHYRYHTKFGIKNSFLLSNKMKDKGTEIIKGSPTILKEKENLGMTSKNEMFFYQASLGLSLGAEWNFMGSTSLVAEISYYYGLTPLFLDRKEENQTLYNNVNGEISSFSNKATQNQLALKLAVLF